MNVGLIPSEDLEHTIESKLNSGWCIFEGDIDIIQSLEEIVYTPGTTKNSGFEIIRFNPCLMIGKKTKELSDLLGNPVDFNEILIIRFIGRDGSKMVTEIIGVKDKASLIPKISKHLSEQLQRKH